MARGKAAKTGSNQKIAAVNKLSRSIDSENRRRGMIDKLGSGAQGAARGQQSQEDSQTRTSLKNSSGLSTKEKVDAINRSGGSMGDIVSKLNKAAEDKKRSKSSGGPKSSRSDAVKKAWQTRKRNGTK